MPKPPGKGGRGFEVSVGVVGAERLRWANAGEIVVTISAASSVAILVKFKTS